MLCWLMACAEHWKYLILYSWDRGVRECNVQRYCIIVAMSPPYPGVGSLEGDHFSDLTVEQLAGKMKQVNREFSHLGGMSLQRKFSAACL